MVGSCLVLLMTLAQGAPLEERAASRVVARATQAVHTWSDGVHLIGLEVVLQAGGEEKGRWPARWDLDLGTLRLDSEAIGQDPRGPLVTGVGQVLGGLGRVLELHGGAWLDDASVVASDGGGWQLRGGGSPAWTVTLSGAALPVRIAGVVGGDPVEVRPTAWGVAPDGSASVTGLRVRRDGVQDWSLTWSAVDGHWLPDGLVVRTGDQVLTLRLHDRRVLAAAGGPSGQP